MFSQIEGATVSATQDSTVRLPADLAEVIAEQERIFAERQPESRRMAMEAAGSLAGGVTSSWQITAPQPDWLSHGRGSKIYDVDGNEYVDLHGGYGAALAGHGHPAIGEGGPRPGGAGDPFCHTPHDGLCAAGELRPACGPRRRRR